MAFYLLYSVSTNSTGFAGSSFKVVEDSNGTPGTTGTQVLKGTGNVQLGAVLSDGVWKPDKTSWEDTISLTGGETLTLHIENAGTPNARAWYSYGGVTGIEHYNIGSLTFARSAAFPAFWTLNNGGEGGTPVWAVETNGAYNPQLTAAEAKSPVSIELTGAIDPDAATNTLKWGESDETDGDELVETTGSYVLTGNLPIVIAGLEPSTTYYFQIVAHGNLGTHYSDVVEATTNAAGVLTTPTVAVADGDADTTKKVTIGNSSNAAFFDIEYGTDSEFGTGTSTARVSNENGAEYFARGLTIGSTYYFRVKAVSGSDDYTDSAWSAAQNAAVTGEAGTTNSAGEIRVRSNIYLDAVPSNDNHVVTLGKVSSLVSAAVTNLGTHVNSIAGLTGTVTFAQLLGAGGTAFVVQGTTDTGSKLTSSVTDAQIVSAKAVYQYVQNVKSSLEGGILGHTHSYLMSPEGDFAVSAPSVLDEATLLSDEVLAPSFLTGTTYQPGAFVSYEGYLYQNTSGLTSKGNADFPHKWQKKTIIDLVNAAGGNNRYERTFTGADLNADFEIEITHGLGEQFVFAEVIDLTSGRNNAVTGAQINLTGTNKLKVTLSSSVSDSDTFKVIVRA